MKTGTKVALGAIGTYIVIDSISIRLTKKNYLKSIELVTELEKTEEDLMKRIEDTNKEDYNGSLDKDIVDMAKKYKEIAYEFEKKASKVKRLKDMELRAKWHEWIGEVRYGRKRVEAIINSYSE